MVEKMAAMQHRFAMVETGGQLCVLGWTIKQEHITFAIIHVSSKMMLATFWYGFFGVDIKTMTCFVDDVVVIVQGAGGQFGKWIEWSPQPLGSRP